MNLQMCRRRRIFEGRGKVIFEGPEPGTLVQYFKDDDTSNATQTPCLILGKGVLNNRISEYLMSRLNEIGVPTHFMRRLNMREQLVRELEMIPLQVQIRNVADRAFAETFGLKEGQSLPRPVMEFFYKKPEAEETPMVSEALAAALGWSHPAELEEMMGLTLRINDYLSGLFLGLGLRLMTLRVEFGRFWDQDDLRIVLADELSPDNVRLWDLRTNEPLSHGGLGQEAYQEVARRLGILPESPAEGSSGNVTVLKERA